MDSLYEKEIGKLKGEVKRLQEHLDQHNGHGLCRVNTLEVALEYYCGHYDGGKVARKVLTGKEER